MASRPPPAFVPRKLARRDLEAPYTPALRRLPRKYREELRQGRQNLLDQTHPFRGRSAERLQRCVAGGAIFFPLVTTLFWFFWFGRGAAPYLAMPFLGAAYGAFLGLVRPSAWIAGATLFLAGLALLLLDGVPPFSGGLGFVWFFHLALFSLGMAVGATTHE